MAGRRTRRRSIPDANADQVSLIGWKQISQYTGLCVSTLIRYTRSDGFPVCHLPDQRMFTTKSLIDQWIMARMTIEQGLAGVVDNSVDKSKEGVRMPGTRIPMR